MWTLILKFRGIYGSTSLLLPVLKGWELFPDHQIYDTHWNNNQEISSLFSSLEHILWNYLVVWPIRSSPSPTSPFSSVLSHINTALRFLSRLWPPKIKDLYVGDFSWFLPRYIYPMKLSKLVKGLSSVDSISLASLQVWVVWSIPEFLTLPIHPGLGTGTYFVTSTWWQHPCSWYSFGFACSCWKGIPFSSAEIYLNLFTSKG